MGFGRRFAANLTRQTTAETESWAVRRFRRQLAGISIVLGAVGGLYPLRDSLHGWLVPGWLLFTVGGIAGLGVWVFRDTVTSRRFGIVAVTATALAIVCFMLAR